MQSFSLYSASKEVPSPAMGSLMCSSEILTQSCVLEKADGTGVWFKELMGRQ